MYTSSTLFRRGCNLAKAPIINGYTLKALLLSALATLGTLWHSHALADEIELANTAIAQDFFQRGEDVHPNLFFVLGNILPSDFYLYREGLAYTTVANIPLLYAMPPEDITDIIYPGKNIGLYHNSYGHYLYLNQNHRALDAALQHIVGYRGLYHRDDTPWGVNDTEFYSNSRQSHRYGGFLYTGLMLPPQFKLNIYTRKKTSNENNLSATLELPLKDNNAYYKKVHSPQLNPLYYNPDITYLPRLNPDGSRMPNMDPTPFMQWQTWKGSNGHTRGGSSGFKWHYIPWYKRQQWTETEYQQVLNQIENTGLDQDTTQKVKDIVSRLTNYTPEPDAREYSYAYWFEDRKKSRLLRNQGQQLFSNKRIYNTGGGTLSNKENRYLDTDTSYRSIDTSYPEASDMRYSLAEAEMWPAYYYRFGRTPDGELISTADTSNPEHLHNPDYYQRVQIHPDQNTYTHANGSRSYAEEVQNFANWYRYYRNKREFTYSLLLETLYQLPANARIAVENMLAIRNDDTQPGDRLRIYSPEEALALLAPYTLNTANGVVLDPYIYLSRAQISKKMGLLGYQGIPVRAFASEHKEHILTQLSRGLFTSYGLTYHANLTATFRNRGKIADYISPTTRYLQLLGPEFNEAWQPTTDKEQYGPWSNTPGQASPEEQVKACRRNHRIYLTQADGQQTTYFYNKDNSYEYHGTNDSIATGPNTTSAEGGVYQYTPQPPYTHPAFIAPAEEALADWATDLRPEQDQIWQQQVGRSTRTRLRASSNDERQALPNLLPSTEANPASWQHIQTHVLGWHWGDGVTGQLYPKPRDEITEQDFDVFGRYVGKGPYSERRTRVKLSSLDAYYQTAINGHGVFRNDFVLTSDQPGPLPMSPQQMADNLANAIKELLVPEGANSTSTVALALESATTPFTGHLYQARLDPRYFTGDLVRLGIDGSGQVAATPDWRAADRLANRTGPRNLLSHTGQPDTGGIAFDFAQLSAEQQALLNRSGQGELDNLGEARVAWLSGNSAGVNTQDTHNRLAPLSGPRLGDIAHSRPVFVSTPEQFYPNDLEATPYSEFRSQHSNRRAMVYVGANDGMLHGFDANNGDEKVGYLPHGVYPHLSQLTDPNYSHRFTVDGSPVVKDVYINNQWRSLLVSPLGRGGAGLFALDVTDPDTLTPNQVLWDVAPSDLGVSLSNLLIEKSNTQDWTVITGNGLNSESGEASLLILNAADGRVLRTLSVPHSDPRGEDRANGLVGIQGVDLDQDQRIDLVYGADLYGNLWRFDLSDSNAANWHAHQVLDNNTGQSITSAPLVVMHDSGHPMVIVGTGQYLSAEDDNSTESQQLYGILDTGSTLTLDSPDSAALQTQRIEVLEPGEGGNTTRSQVRRVTHRPLTESHQGWTLALPTPGERVTLAPVIHRGRLVVSTLIPGAGDGCRTADAGFIMELDPRTGGHLPVPVRNIHDDPDNNDINQLTEADRVVNPAGEDTTAYGGIATVTGAPSQAVSFFVIDDRVQNQFNPVDLVPSTSSTPPTTTTPTPGSSGGFVQQTSFICVNTGTGEVLCEQQGRPRTFDESGDPVRDARQAWRQLSP